MIKDEVRTIVAESPWLQQLRRSMIEATGHALSLRV
jgi:hypothetical protein